MIGEHPFHVAGRKYVDAVRLAGCLPLVVPWAGADEVDELLALADGVLLTGSPSNVHPSLFGQEVHNPSLPLDPVRDEWTLPLDTQGARTRCAAVRDLPRFPGDERRARWHAAPGDPRGARQGRPPRRADRRLGRSAIRASRTTSASCPAACSRASSVPAPCASTRCTTRAPTGWHRARAPRPWRRTVWSRPSRCPTAQRLQPVPAMAPRMEGGGESVVDEAAARIRRGLPALSGPTPRAGARPGLLGSKPAMRQHRAAAR